MVADQSAGERLRLVAESAKRIRELVSSDEEFSAIELSWIASDIEFNAMELAREFAALALPNLSPRK